jgi:hypothetical protein
MPKLVLVLLIAALATISPSLAFAYVGPGAGLSALGSLVSLLAAIGLAIVGFVWYPIRRLLRRLRAREPQAGE